jgi:hypothetical protein
MQIRWCTSSENFGKRLISTTGPEYRAVVRVIPGELEFSAHRLISNRATREEGVDTATYKIPGGTIYHSSPLIRVSTQTCGCSI